ncbi:Sarcosine oxidase [Globisporangium polare]
MADVFDVVVVGAGLMGSSAAYYASKAGKRVLLLEQFELLHARGSSHGRSRIFRVAYPNGVYTKLCLESLKLWHEIEKEAGDGVTLIEMTGELDFAKERNADLVQLEATLAQHDVPFETLTGVQANARFPGFSLDESDYAVFNSHAGVLNPDLAMATLQSLAQKHGAVIRGSSKVTDIFASGDGDLAVIELADGASISARQCIVTSGAWTTSVLKNAPTSLKIQPIATYGTYWKCTSEEVYKPANFPVFINYEDEFIYGLPMMDPKEGVKICRHDGPNVDPDTRAGVEQPAELAARLREYVTKNFAHVDASAPSKTDHCMYSMTADENFIIDFLPVPSAASSQRASTKNVVVGAGFSGHGAKMTPVIGKILAELALEGKTSHNIELFRASRAEVATPAAS